MVQHRYGPVGLLELQDVEVPAVKDDGILIRVRASSVNPYDWHHVLGQPYLVRAAAGLRRPGQPIRGVDLAGEVAAVGRDVTRFRPGDRVYGMGSGAFAEYVSAAADKMVPMPANLTFEQAAAVPMAALTALQGLRDKGRIGPGQRVLVNGASGGIGTFAVQIAKSFGAEVTAVCSTHNVDTARSLGADDVVDYTRTDFVRTDLVRAGKRYDLILDLAGTRTFAERRSVLTATGTLVLISGPKTNRWVGPMGMNVKALLIGPFSSQRLVGMLTRNSAADLATMADLLSAGTVVPFIERTYPLPDVPAALEYVGAGHARGKIVVTV